MTMKKPKHCLNADIQSANSIFITDAAKLNT